MNIIALDEEAFYELYAKLVADIRKQLDAAPHRKWIDGKEVMDMLGIKSKTPTGAFYVKNQMLMRQIFECLQTVFPNWRKSF